MSLASVLFAVAVAGTVAEAATADSTATTAKTTELTADSTATATTRPDSSNHTQKQCANRSDRPDTVLPGATELVFK
jgi:hypothetical protein